MNAYVPESNRKELKKIADSSTKFSDSITKAMETAVLASRPTVDSAKTVQKGDNADHSFDRVLQDYGITRNDLLKYEYKIVEGTSFGREKAKSLKFKFWRRP
jgi:hypothetical protein